MDVKQLLDPSKIIEGVLLYTDSPGKTPSDASISTGRVIFSLRELPKGVNFRTERGNKVVRTSSWEVTLGDEYFGIPRNHPPALSTAPPTCLDDKRCSISRNTRNSETSSINTDESGSSISHSEAGDEISSPSKKEKKKGKKYVFFGKKKRDNGTPKEGDDASSHSSSSSRSSSSVSLNTSSTSLKSNSSKEEKKAKEEKKSKTDKKKKGEGFNFNQKMRGSFSKDPQKHKEKELKDYLTKSKSLSVISIKPGEKENVQKKENGKKSNRSTIERR
eukprot:TRINITY_DN919_c0_g1_i1.p1 TRINITY_DN919_c0_g1~~TRINITY_DN919_c0_g1_i1.p1  ORF type:complete len:275 (-),score=114.12 TRINITY_DN919_c0_g1_i1:53-877(-)